MIRKIGILGLVLVMALSMFTGCSDTVSEIAGNVADAAMKELEKQVKETLEKNKVEVIELKTVFGKLNDDGSSAQFFCAALVKADTELFSQAAVDAMDGLVTEAGLLRQTGSKVENEHLVHKDITFKHSDFSSDNYFVIYAYHADLSAGMPTLGGK